MKKFFRKILKEYFLYKQRSYAINLEEKNMNHLNLKKITNEEYNQIKNIWGRIGVKPYSLFYKMFKTVVKFDPLYLSDDLYYPIILKTLNPHEYSKVFAHKVNFSYLFKDILQPKTLFFGINGICYDYNMNVLSQQDLIDKIRLLNDFIIKPSKDSSCGKGVQLILKDNYSELVTILNSYNGDFIIQERLKQSQLTAIFNKSSLNCFRITTLFINGIATTESIVFKVGSINSIVDNLGAGGCIVGVSVDGKFNDFGFDNKYNKQFKSSSGKIFAGYQIKEVSEMCNLMEFYHRKYMPQIGIIGWDVALNIDNTPIVIEANINFPGIQFEQLAISKPIFGDRTEEVIDFVIKNKK